MKCSSVNIFKAICVFMFISNSVLADVYTKQKVCSYSSNKTICFSSLWQFDVDENENSYFLKRNPPSIVGFNSAGKMIIDSAIPYKLTAIDKWHLFAGNNMVLIIPQWSGEMITCDVTSSKFNKFKLNSDSAQLLRFVDGKLLDMRNRVIWSCDGNGDSPPALISPKETIRLSRDASGHSWFCKKGTNLKVPKTHLESFFWATKTVDFEGNVFASYAVLKEGKTQVEDDDFRLVRLNKDTLLVEQFWSSLWKVQESTSFVYSLEMSDGKCWLIRWKPNAE